MFKTSPSFTKYSLPSNLIFALLFEFADPLLCTKSVNDTVSALMNPFSKSVCISPAAFGAVQFFDIVNALDSSEPEVKNVSIFNN